MMTLIHPKLLGIFFTLCLAGKLSAYSQDSSSASSTKRYRFPSEVTVTGSRLPNDGKNPRHTLVVIHRQDIERSTARSVEEVLRNIAGIDVRQRGIFGVQADISIRGGTFEQTLIMIDGIKMIDPQTGHHAMNIPLALDDIERIEVLKGPGSRQYGPNAFNGAINIVTRRHRKPTARLQATIGEFDLLEGSLAGGAPLHLDESSMLCTRASFLHRRSSGYRPNTDFTITTAAAGTQLMSNDIVSLESSVNYTDKKFGANGFYALTFPTQYEETTTLFAHITADLRASMPTRVVASWRRNTDYFILRRENPAFYRNVHTSNTLSVEAQTTIFSLFGATLFGSEYAADLLESTNLGNRQRTRWSIFAEHQIKPIDNMTLELGVTALFNSDWGWNFAPGADIGWQLTDNIALHASAAQSFRIPSYTELYYSDRVTRGNPQVQPERAWTFELGGRWREGIANFEASVFRRYATQLIDYVRTSTTALWQAENLTAALTYGIDIHIALNTRDILPFVEHIQASYTYLDPTFTVEPGLQSRYVLDQLRHQACVVVDMRWFHLVANQWRFRYEERLNTQLTGAFVDVRLSCVISGFEVFAEATNLFNAAAFDFIGLPLPGRWLRAGVAARLSDILL
ncbi:MAG: TonB-dependent receptor [Bacteroidota bacterium]|nr:TonB-dependent receptor [Candidatus Kapabacteria bacterium]MDW8221056.1 TonB-dependent receptor [Bacteroidota bacterium]